MNKYLKKSTHYFAGNIFNKIILIAFLPIFTHFMIPAEYAVYTNFLIFISFANLIFFMGMQQSIISYFYAESSNEYKFTLIISIYIIVIATGIILSIVILLNGNILSQLIVRNQDYNSLIPYIVVIIFTSCIYGLTLSILNMMEHSANYAILGGAKNIILLFLFLYGAFTKQFTVYTVFHFITISSIITALLAFVNMIIILKNFVDGSFKPRIFSFRILKPVLKFGIVMIPGTLSILILQASDRYMLTYLSANTMHDVGIYSAGYKIGMIMHFLVTIISLVYLPYAMKISKEPQAQTINKSMFKYYIIFGSFFGAFIIMYSQEIFRIIIDSNYMTSYKIVFAGVFSSFLFGIFNIVNINYYARKKAGNITLAVLIGSILNIILNFALIPKYGIFGAGIASVIAYFFIVIFNYSVAVYLYKIKYNVSLIFFGLLILTIAALLNSYVIFSWMSFIVKTIIFLGIIGVSYFIMKKDRKIQNLLMLLKQEKQEK